MLAISLVTQLGSQLRWEKSERQYQWDKKIVTFPWWIILRVISLKEYPIDNNNYKWRTIFYRRCIFLSQTAVEEQELQQILQLPNSGEKEMVHVLEQSIFVHIWPPFSISISIFQPRRRKPRNLWIIIDFYIANSVNEK